MPKCKSCKNEFVKIKPLQTVCSLPCAIAYTKEKAEKKAKQEWNKEKREFRQKDKTYTQRLNEARKVFQKWIRLRDKDQPCISCGCTTAKQWDAGHFLKAELFSGLIFNEFNVFRQCSSCNNYLSGNELMYRKGLIKRIGVEKVEELESMADSMRIHKYSNEELQSIVKIYSLKIKQLEKR